MLQTAPRHIAIAAALAASLVFGGEAVSGQDTQPRIRTIPWDLSKPIAERIQLDDNLVEIDGSNFDVAVFARRPTSQQVLRTAIGTALDVAIVDVTSTRSELIENGATIATFLTGTVQEVLKSSPRFSLRDRHPVTVILGGGAVRIGRTIVRTLGDVRYLPPVGRYVLFMGPTSPYSDARDTSFRPMRVMDDKVWPVTIGDEALLLNAMSLDSIRKEAKRQSSAKGK